MTLVVFVVVVVVVFVIIVIVIVVVVIVVIVVVVIIVIVVVVMTLVVALQKTVHRRKLLRRLKPRPSKLSILMKNSALGSRRSFVVVAAAVAIVWRLLHLEVALDLTTDLQQTSHFSH